MSSVVYFKRSAELALPLTRENDDDAGTDLYASHDVVIQPGEIVCIYTHIHLALPARSRVQLVGKSGRAGKFFNEGAGLVFTPIGMVILAGLIDCGYRDDIRVIASNLGQKPIVISHGSACCQMEMMSETGLMFPTLIELAPIEFDNLPPTKRKGGFGSTDRRVDHTNKIIYVVNEEIGIKSLGLYPGYKIVVDPRKV